MSSVVAEIIRRLIQSTHRRHSPLQHHLHGTICLPMSVT